MPSPRRDRKPPSLVLSDPAVGSGFGVDLAHALLPNRRAVSIGSIRVSHTLYVKKEGRVHRVDLDAHACNVRSEARVPLKSRDPARRYRRDDELKLGGLAALRGSRCRVRRPLLSRAGLVPARSPPTASRFLADPIVFGPGEGFLAPIAVPDGLGHRRNDAFGRGRRSD